MKTADILQVRLHNQQLAAQQFQTPAELVAHMGVIQAQEYHMSKWAIGMRLPGTTEQAIDMALDKGEILRTHVLRPTWHYVAAEDIHWMLALSVPQNMAAVKSRFKVLGITAEMVKKSNKLIDKALSNGEHLTRKELVAILEKAKIDAKNEVGGHLLFMAELEGIACNGAHRGKEITYALLSSRVANGKSFSREEALAKLAKRYFNSHGPATVQDFIWWSGLSITEGKKALELVKNEFEQVSIDEQMFYFSPNIKMPDAKKSTCLLIPPYDEYVIGYADRTMLIKGEGKEENIFENGLSRPNILVNGKSIGNWKRTIKKDKTIIELKFFKAPAKTVLPQIKKAAKSFGQFIGQKTEIQ